MPSSLILLGAALVVLGAVGILLSSFELRARRLLLRTPVSPVDACTGDAIVKIRGRAVPLDDRVVVAPFSGRPAVWVRAIVSEYRGGKGGWATVFEDLQEPEFGVDDGSGPIARILPKGAKVLAKSEEIAGTDSPRDIPARIDAFVRDRGLKTTGPLGIKRKLRFVEHLLGPDDVVSVVGTPRRQVGPPVAEGYRSNPATRLSFSTPSLFLSNLPETEWTSRSSSALFMSMAFVCVGAGFILMEVVGDRLPVK
jgi:hypothetical protein